MDPLPSLTAAPADGAPSAATPVFTLGPSALAQVKSVIKSQGYEGYFFTVRVIPSGCSGLGYDLNLLKDSRAGDLLWEQDGVRLCTDPVSSRYLLGTQIDHDAGAVGARFTFSNPNSKSSCGCGSSFST